MFFTIEGIEGAGKSTILKRLHEKLNKAKIENKITTEPRGINNELGKKITEIIKREDIDPLSEFFLFSAFRNMHVRNEIKPWIEKNNIVICDRFIHSSIVYQGILGKTDIEFIKFVNHKILNDLKIDQIFLIDLDVEVAKKRVNQRSKESDKFDQIDLEFHKIIRNGYLTLLKDKKNATILDGSLPIDEIVEKIYLIILNIMHENDR